MSSSRVILPQGLITPQEVDGSGVLPMPESSFRALLGKPVPAIRVEDLKRVWSFLVEQDRDHPKTSVDVKLLERFCPPDTNVMAVHFRSTLITILLRQGRLGRQSANTLPDQKVFEVVANFPLPEGPQKVDIDALVATLGTFH